MKKKSPVPSEVLPSSPKNPATFNAMFAMLVWFALLTSVQGGVPLWTNYSGVYPQQLNTTDKGNHLLATDHNGNVIVAGMPPLQPPYDYVTVKMSSSGVSLWTNRFTSPWNSNDVATAVAVDSANNVFVTGTATYSTDTDYVTIKYSSAGTPLWTNRYNGPAGTDGAVAMVVDSAGNVFVTGNSRGTGGNNEWATVKYSNSGILQWVQRYSDPASSDAWPVSVAVDGTNVYVFGYNAAGEFVTIAYHSGYGTPVWTDNYTFGTGNSRAVEIATDNSGHVFLTGYMSKGMLWGTTPSDHDFVTLAYSSAGSLLWTNHFAGPGADNNDRPVGLAVSNGKVFVLGSSGSSVGGEVRANFATIAYSITGAPLWTNRFAGSWGDDFPEAIAADSAGNVFVTGLRGDAALNTSYCVTVAYSDAGTLLWTDELRYDVITPTEIAVDSADNVFVTGYGASRGVTLKYAPSLPPSQLGYQWVNGKLILNWSGGCTLQSAPSASGPYTDVAGATSPYIASPAGPQLFFKLNCN